MFPPYPAKDLVLSKSECSQPFNILKFIYKTLFVKNFLFPHQTTKLPLFCQEKFYKKLKIN